MKTLQILSFLLVLAIGLPSTINAQSKSKVIIIEEYVDEDGNVQTKKTITEGGDLKEMEGLFESEMLRNIEIEEFTEGGERRIIIETDGENEANIFRFDMHEDHPFLGVHLDDNESGLTISNVVKESAAATAGLQEGDVIRTFNGSAVRGSTEFIEMIAEKAVGENVELGIQRDGKDMVINATLGKKPHSGFKMKQNQCEDVQKFKWNDQSFHGTSPQGNRDFFMSHRGHRLGVSVLESEAGLEVKSVKPGSVADRNGVKIGDIITHHDGNKIESTDAFATEIGDKKAGTAYELKLLRDGKKEKITITVDTPEDKMKLRRL